MKHVAIIGSALAGNKGAAAMLESAIQTLDDGSTEFTLLSMYPSADREQNIYDNLRIVDASPLKLGLVINSFALVYRLLPFSRSFLKQNSPAINVLAQADVLLDQGGITFVDGREKFLLYNVASILPAINMKVPIVKCAQALGPFQNPINRFAAKTFLPKVAAIISRGRITHEYLNELGLTNVKAGADYAFLLKLTAAERRHAKSKFSVDKLKGRKIVGLSPSRVMQKKIEASGGDYIGLMASFANYLTEAGYSVMLVAHSMRNDPTKLHNNDMPLCNAIYDKVKDKESVLFLDKELSSQELRYWIGECDFFIASRFHAMVSSLAMGVPTLVIGWSHKYEEVLEMFELKKWAIGQDKLSLEQLTTAFEELLREEKLIRAKLKEHLANVNAKSAIQVDIVKSILKRAQR